MKKKLLAVLSCALILLLCIGALVACNCEHEYKDGVCVKCGQPDPDYKAPCDHVYVDGVCTKCGETDPDYVAEKKDYDMSGVKFEDKTVFFNGKAQALTITGALPQGVTVAYAYYSDEQHVNKVTEIVNPGVYYVVASFTGGGDNYNPIDDKTAKLTISKADYDMSGVKLENAILPYSGSAQELTVTGTLPQGVTVKYVYATDAAFENEIEKTDIVNPGRYYVKAVFTGQEGYNAIADKTATLTISKLDLPQGVTFNDKAIDYDGQAHSLTLTGELPSKVSASYKFFTDEECKMEVQEMVDAGEYYVQVTLTGDDNYAENLVAKLTINKATVAAIAFENKEVTYNGEAQGDVIKLAVDLPAGAESVTYKYYSDSELTEEVAAADVVNAGAYYVKAIFTVDPNYNAIADKTAVLTVEKKPVEATFDNKTAVYTGEALDTVMTIGDLPEGVTAVDYEFYTDNGFTEKVEKNQVVNAGTYYVKAILTVSDNYSAEELKAQLTIDKAPIKDFAADSVAFSITSKHGSENAVTITEQNGVYTAGEYNPGTSYEIAATVNDYNGTAGTITYYTGLENGVLTNPIGALSKKEIANFADSLYVCATFTPDDNHASSVYKTVKLSKYTVHLKTYDDLLIMREHIYGDNAITTANRRGIIYSLENDIDCRNALWTPVAYIMEWLDNPADLLENTFCSEFNGNGHTISNYRITDESIDLATVPTEGSYKNTIFVGFFGRVNNGVMYGGTVKGDLELEQEACNIHDVTFDNVTVKFDAKNPNYKLGQTKIVAGFVVGYTDTGNQHTFGRTNLYNIAVKNSTMDIDAYDIYAGGIIGEEHIATNYAGLRKNLDVNNCSIYAISSKGGENNKVYIGGLVGRWHAEVSGTPDNDSDAAAYGNQTWWTRYHDCDITNIKLGYNYQAVSAFNSEAQAASDAYVPAKAAVDAAQKKIDDINAQIAEAEAKVAVLQVKVDETREALKEATHVLNHASADTQKEAQAAYDAAYAAHDTANHELEDARNKLEALRADTADDLAAAQDELAAAQVKLAAAQVLVDAVKAKQAPYMHAKLGDIYVGLFFGSIEDMNVTFNNCSVTNYLIAHTSPSAFYTGVYGYGNNNKHLVNTTITEGDWNDGLHGIYGVPNDQGMVTKQEIDRGNLNELWKWENFSLSAEANTTVLDKKENVALDYLGLNQ